MHVWMPFKIFLHQVDFKDTPTSEKLVIFNIQKLSYPNDQLMRNETFWECYGRGKWRCIKFLFSVISNKNTRSTLGYRSSQGRGEETHFIHFQLLLNVHHQIRKDTAVLIHKIVKSEMTQHKQRCLSCLA